MKTTAELITEHWWRRIEESGKEALAELVERHLQLSDQVTAYRKWIEGLRTHLSRLDDERD